MDHRGREGCRRIRQSATDATDTAAHLAEQLEQMGQFRVGDPLGLLGRAAGWLAPGGLLIAHLDPEAIRFPDGAPAGRAAVAALRAAGSATAPATTGSPSTGRGVR